MSAEPSPVAGTLQQAPSNTRTTALAIITAALLVAGSILAHAYVTRPPRYQIVSLGSNRLIVRVDTQTGQATLCILGEGDVYECPSR
jgi:hypothetical protein